MSPVPLLWISLLTFLLSIVKSSHLLLMIILLSFDKVVLTPRSIVYGFYISYCNDAKHYPKTIKYWVGVQLGQSYLMGRRCLFSLCWPPFQLWYHDKNTLWGRCFITSTSLAPHLFLLGWLKLNLILLLDQLRLAQGDEHWWQL